MGSKKKDKSTVTVTTPPPDEGEVRNRQKAEAAQDLSMNEAGYTWDGTAWQQRAPTAEETQQADRDKQIDDLIYSKLTGKISPEDAALVEEAYGSALNVGKSDMNAEFSRALEQLKIGEGRGYEDIKTELMRGTEDINRSAREAAAARGLNLTDSPILNERQQLFQRFGEDINRTSSRLTEDVAGKKQMLGEDFGRNLRNFETSIAGAKAGATLDVGQRQQLFAENLRQFQAQLQQQAQMNRQMIGEGFSNTAFGLGNLRSRNITQVSKGSGSAGGGAGSIMGGAGGMIGGIGSLFSSGAGGTSAASGIGSMFSSMSSREFKENIEPADIDRMLEELEATPLYNWNYKGQARTHIGPVTEEAPARIVDGNVLVHIDYLGFLFGALKALHKKVKRLETGARPSTVGY